MDEFRETSRFICEDANRKAVIVVERRHAPAGASASGTASDARSYMTGDGRVLRQLDDMTFEIVGNGQRLKRIKRH